MTMRVTVFWIAVVLAAPAQVVSAGGCLGSAQRPAPTYGGRAPASRGEAAAGLDRAPGTAVSETSRRGRYRPSRGLSRRLAGLEKAKKGLRHHGPPVAALAPPPSQRASSRQVAGSQPVPPRQHPGRMIVYLADLTVQVLDPKDAMEEALKITLGAGGYLQRRTNNLLVVRIPVAQFRALLARLEKLGEVRRKSVRAEDVTRQYTDLLVRLRAAEVVLERLKALLARAKTVRESIAIEREMARVLEKIERFKGTLRYLQHHASLSTIRLVFEQRPADRPPVRSRWRNPFRWVRSLGLYSVMRF